MLKAVLFLSLFSVAFAGDCPSGGFTSELTKILACHALSDPSGFGCVGPCKYCPDSFTPYYCEYSGSSCSATDYSTNNRSTTTVTVAPQTLHSNSLERF